MSIEDIIAKILSARPELTREEVLKMIKDREESSGGFLTRESAALSLAADLGVTIKKFFKGELHIKDLVSGLNDVTVCGRVINVSPLRKFFRHDGSEGFKRSMDIADETGVIRVILWDEKAAFLNAENLIDRVIRVSHASVRRKTGGKLELNTGLRSRIEIDPEDLRSKDFPPIINFTKRICDLSSKEKEATVIGLIEQIHPVTTFRRQDGSEGKVRRIELSDSTGKVTLVLWDEKADSISEGHEGRYIMVMGAKTKERFDGKIEIHTGSRTRIITLKKPSGLR
ncbi:MAG: OB-fold nucleic acid binding domain-containing protein [Candidatus Bathyarchaeia archaeon]